MLTFAGLGLFDEKDITLKGLEAVRDADMVYAEFYTSALMGTTIERMEKLYGKKIRILHREDIEQSPDWLLDAKHKNVVLLSGGDAMVATTHVDLRLRAHQMGIQTRIIHAPSISSAVCGLSGLQNYRFGKSATVPFPWGRPSATPYDVILNNLKNDLHTLVFLDIDRENGYMTVNQALGLLLEVESTRDEKTLGGSIAVGIARAGSDSPLVKADYVGKLREFDFGAPLHILVIPASLHFIEAEALVGFAGAPPEIIPRR